MYLRCLKCYACSRILALNNGQVVCAQCDRRYAVRVPSIEHVSLEA